MVSCAQIRDEYAAVRDLVRKNKLDSRNGPSGTGPTDAAAETSETPDVESKSTMSRLIDSLPETIDK